MADHARPSGSPETAGLLQPSIEHTRLTLFIHDGHFAHRGLAFRRISHRPDFVFLFAHWAVNHFTVFAHLEGVFLIFHIDDLDRIGCFADKNQLVSWFEGLKVSLFGEGSTRRSALPWRECEGGGDHDRHQE